MKKTFAFFAFLLLGSATAQTSFRPGIVAGTNFSYPDKSTVLTDGFFTTYRSGLLGGFSGVVTVNDHFIFKTGLIYNTQSVGLRGDNPDFRTDIRVNSDNLLLPIQIGYQNKLGSLILREIIGISFNQNLNRRNVIKIDSKNQMPEPAYSVNELMSKQFMPMINFGLEIGSIFNSDAGFFIGVHYRQGFSRFYQFEYNGSYFNGNQFFSSKSNFLAIELTYYFSRPSLWFKKEFEF